MIVVVVLTPTEPTPADLAQALDAVAAVHPELRAYQDPATGLLHLLESQTVIALTIEPTRHVQIPTETRRLLATAGPSNSPTWWTETHANKHTTGQQAQRTFSDALAQVVGGQALVA